MDSTTEQHRNHIEKSKTSILNIRQDKTIKIVIHEKRARTQISKIIIHKLFPSCYLRIFTPGQCNWDYMAFTLYCFFFISRFRKEGLEAHKNTCLKLKSNCKIISLTFKVCDLVKIRCLGSLYILNGRNTKGNNLPKTSRNRQKNS